MRKISRGQGSGIRGQGLTLRCVTALLLATAVFGQQSAEKPKAEEQAPAAPAVKTGDQTAAAPAPAAKTGDQTAAASPAPATEQWLTGFIDFGYRWVSDVGGNFTEYRSVVNLGQGPKLFGFDFTVRDPKKRLFDYLTARGMGWGGEPYTTAHVDARKWKVYDFRFDYRNIAYFNAVPSFANPFIPAGFDEQSFDTRIRATSLDLDLRPGSRIVPYLAYDRNSDHGRGIETWVLGATDEFPVPYTVRNSTNNYRAGVRFEYNRMHVTLEQGGTTFKDDNGINYTGPNPGDRTVIVNGVQLNLNSLQQAYGISGHSVYNRGLLTARPLPWLNVYGQFLYSIPKTYVTYTELATGQLFDFATQLLFASQFGVASGNAVQPHVSGNIAAEASWKRLRFMEFLSTDRQHDSATGLFAQTLFQAAPPTAATSTSLLNPFQVVNYTQSETNVFFDVTPKLTLRGGYRYLHGDAEVMAGSLSQIGPEVSGELRRNIGIAGVTYRPSQKITAHMDYEGSSSDHIYFRNSLNDYSKARIRGKYQPLNSLLFEANFSVLNNTNPAPDIRFDFEARTNAISVFWSPSGGKRITITGEYDRSTVRSSIIYLDLPFLSPATSIYRENSHTATGAIDMNLPRLSGAKLTAGGSMVLSSGSRPTNYYQPLARLVLPLHKRIQWFSEWQYYGFGESFYLFEGFRTHLFMTGLRVSQ
jgi:hypothetical protein